MTDRLGGVAGPTLTIAICSNRPELAERAANLALQATQIKDTVMVVLEAPVLVIDRFVRRMTECGVLVVPNPEGGLSRSRNQALSSCPDRYVIFIDDDVILNADVVAKVRLAFAAKWDIVGVRLVGPGFPMSVPWYVTSGQFHYLAIHADSVSATWGACMGIALDGVLRHGVRFREDLGRRVGTLLSAEDSSFLAELRSTGARETFLDEASVRHEIQVDRLQLTQMLRRAYWQGRSEVIRGQPLKGLTKEVGRNFGAAASPRGFILALVYTASVGTGILAQVVRDLYCWLGGAVRDT